MTYDDVAEIKEALQLMARLLERMAVALEHIQTDTTIIEDNVADIAHALLRPSPLPGDPE